MSKFQVYELVDPRNNQPFYVGFTGRGNARINEHIAEAKSQRSDINPIKAQIIREILSINKLPEMRILFESKSESKALSQEEFWISEYGRLDKETGSLTNRSNGGQGSNGHTMSDSSKQRLSRYRKGKSYEDIFGNELAAELKSKRKEQTSGIGNPMFGQSHTLETRTKISESKQGLIRNYSHTEQHRESIRESNRNRTVTEETRMKLKAAAAKNLSKYQPRSDYVKQKISEGHIRASNRRKQDAPVYSWCHNDFGQLTTSRYCLAAEYGLSIGELGKVLSGQFKHHKGWRLV